METGSSSEGEELRRRLKEMTTQANGPIRAFREVAPEVLERILS